MPPDEGRINAVAGVHGARVYRLYARPGAVFDREYYDEILEALPNLVWAAQLRSPAERHFDYGYVVILEGPSNPGEEMLRKRGCDNP